MPLRVTAEYRNDALRRATVWRAPRDRSQAALTTTPDPDGTFAQTPLECRFEPDSESQSPTQFECVMQSGESVTVRHGATGEVQAAVAASRLLARLGFSTDPVYLVPQLRCDGCPRRPFELSWAADRLALREIVTRPFSSSRYVDFEWVAVERRVPGRAVETNSIEGWTWRELADLNPLDGHRGERDALTLAAVVLSHPDNTASKQRLVCLDDNERAAQHCDHPLALIHDLGSTFGPQKMDLASWRRAPVWSDPARCVVSVREVPDEGGTFRDITIGEPGRRLLLRELDAISEADVYAWLKSARFTDPLEWVGAFEEKLQQIRTAGPCPLN